VPTVIKKALEKRMSTMAQRPPEGSPSKGRDGVFNGNYRPAQWKGSPWEEDIIGLATFEDYEKDKVGPGSILLGPQECMVQIN
jgi:hypothetical protein